MSNKTSIIANFVIVDKLPISKRKARSPEYDAVFNSILESFKDDTNTIAKLNVKGKVIKQFYAPIVLRIKDFNNTSKQTYKLALRIRGKIAYIIKIPS